MPRVLFFLILLFAFIDLAIPQNSMGLERKKDESLPTLDLIKGEREQVFRGAELYDWHCSVCHGPTGLGLEEAILAFPESHQNCERCHRRNNPTTRAAMQGNQNEHQVFSIGVAPDLRTPGKLFRFPTASVLYVYIQSAMPRYEPGKLTFQESLDITAFLLALQNIPLDEDLTDQNAMQLFIFQ